LRHQGAFWELVSAHDGAFDKLLLFFLFFFYSLMPNRAVFGGESSRKIERERGHTTSGIPQMTW
jgi:hypothetical protein